MVLHTNSSSSGGHFANASDADLTGPRTVGLVAFVLFGIVSVVVPLAAIGRRVVDEKLPWLLPPQLAMCILATALVACGWLFAGLNTLLFDGSSLARVLLNAAVWAWTLNRLAEFYELDERLRTNVYEPLVKGCLALLVFAMFGGSALRFVALLGVLPLAVLVLLSASLWAGSAEKAVWNPPGVVIRRTQHDFSSLCGTGLPQIRPGQLILAVVGATGVAALIAECLSKEYGGIASLTLSFALMLPIHAVLVLVCMGIAMFALSPLPREGAQAAVPLEPTHAFEPGALALAGSPDDFLNERR